MSPQGRVSLATFLLAMGLTACGASEPLPAGPNVLLVTIDTLRSDHVGAYGSEIARTPTLDRLAQRGVRFETAVAAAPLTLPSHATILTGLYPPSHGARHNGIHRLDDAVTTLAERFQAGGWSTAGVIGASVLASSFGIAQGFDHFDERFGDDSRRASAVGFPERSATEVSDRAIKWLDDRGERPFFLWVHYYDPHARYAPPEPYRSQFAGQPYDGEIAYVDHELGRLIDFIEKKGALGETVIAVTSDHGEGLGEHGEAAHSYFVYDSVLKVPLIFAGPGIPAATKREEVSSVASIAPTLQSLAGLAADASLDGHDLTQEWSQRESARDHWAYAEGLASRFDHGWSPLFAIRTDGDAFIRAPRSELYELAQDPEQRSNVLGSELATGDLAARVQQANARIDAVHARGRTASEANLDAETRAQIEALGYVVPVSVAAENGADPKDVHHLAELQYTVNAHYFAGRLDEALALGERGLKDLPDSPMLLDMLARVWAAKGEPDKAIPYAERAAGAVPEWVGYWVQLADLQLSIGALDDAIENYQRGVRVAPEDPDARAGSVWRCLRGEVEQARKDADMAFEHGGDWAGRYETIGNTWERCGEYEEANAVYLAGADRFPEDPRLQMRLAVQWARAGERAKSEAARSRAGDAADDPDLVSYLAVAHAVRGDTDRAAELLTTVLDEHPDHVMARRFQARLQANRANSPAKASEPPTL